MQGETIDACELVDGLIQKLVDARVPPVPALISDTLTSVFCRGFGFSDAEYDDYRAEIDRLVFDRWRVFVGRQENIDLGPS